MRTDLGFSEFDAVNCSQIAPQTEAQLRLLSLEQLEALSEALLDFTSPADLEAWLRA